MIGRMWMKETVHELPFVYKARRQCTRTPHQTRFPLQTLQEEGRHSPWPFGVGLLEILPSDSPEGKTRRRQSREI